jgi:tetratricopeptide (TPR) repeat protein
LGKSSNQKELIFRCKTSIGRIYVQSAKYQKAIQNFQECLEIAENSVDQQWLCHDIGRCALHLTDFELALKFGQKAIEYTNNDDLKWNINIRVLIAQSLKGMHKFKEATKEYESAFEFSKLLGDRDIGLSLWKSMEDLKLYKFENEMDSVEDLDLKKVEPAIQALKI